MLARMVARIATFFLALIAQPAWASGATPVPEASSATLFALGVLGVLIGRRASIRRSAPRRKRD